MTMGRPPSIPDSLVKLDLPQPFNTLAPRDTETGRPNNDAISTQFYVATM